ncbi:MAG: hypothetical protein ACPG5B_02740 [Chitinophagales bacterium]
MRKIFYFPNYVMALLMISMCYFSNAQVSAQTQIINRTTTQSSTKPLAKSLVGEVLSDGSFMFKADEATIKRAIEEEFYDGTTVNSVKIVEMDGQYYVFADGNVKSGQQKIIRVSLEKTAQALFFTTVSALETCYALHCEEQEFVVKNCKCNVPTEMGMSTYQAQRGFLLTKKGIGGLLTLAKTQASAVNPTGEKAVVIGKQADMSITIDKSKLHKAITEELADKTTIITESFVKKNDKGQHYLFAIGKDGNYTTTARLNLSTNANGDLFIKPTSLLELCINTCTDTGTFMSGGNCNCAGEVKGGQKDIVYTYKSNFFSQRLGIGSLFGN